MFRGKKNPLPLIAPYPPILYITCITKPRVIQCTGGTEAERRASTKDVKPHNCTFQFG